MVNALHVQMLALLVQTIHTAEHAWQEQQELETLAHVQLEPSSPNNQPDTVKDVNKVVFCATQMAHVYNVYQTINLHLMVNAFVALVNSQHQQVSVQPVPAHNVLHAKIQLIVSLVEQVMSYNKENVFQPVVKDTTEMVQIV